MLSIKKRSRWLALGVALAVLSGGSASAAPMYTLTDLGLARNDATADPVGFNNTIHIDASGNITHGPSGSQLGLIQAGNYSAHQSSTFAYYSVAGGPLTEIHAPNSSWETKVFGLNAAGQLIGTAYGPSDTGDAYIYSSQGGFKFIPTIAGKNEGAPLAINDLGQIVGQGRTASGFGLAFLSDGMTSVNLNTLIESGLGLTLINASGINNRGQIVGQAEDSQSKIHEYLLTPIPVSTPEPTSFSLFVIVTLGAAARGLVRRVK